MCHFIALRQKCINQKFMVISKVIIMRAGPCKSYPRLFRGQLYQKIDFRFRLKLNLHGPPGLKNLLKEAKVFMRHDQGTCHFESVEFYEKDDTRFEDDQMTIFSVHIHPSRQGLY